MPLLQPTTLRNPTTATHTYLVGVIDVSNDGFHPVLVVGGGPRRPEVSQDRRGVEQVGVVEVLKYTTMVPGVSFRYHKRGQGVGG